MKRLVLRIMLILLLASVLTMAFNAGSTDATGQVFYPPHSGWDVFYSADKLPNESEPPWVLTESFVGISVASVSNGILEIDTTSESGEWYYRRNWNANNLVGVTVEANLTIKKASVHEELELNIADGVHAAMITFFEDRVALYKVDQYFMNTTDGYHVYRIIAKGDDIFLYVDNLLRLDGTNKFTFETSENRVIFGDAGVPFEVAGAISDWDYVAYTINGAHPLPDLAVTEVKPSKTVVCQGYSLNINVTIINYGSETETFNLTTYANTTVVGKQEIILTNGDKEDMPFTWNTTEFAKGNYTISAYAWPVPGEIDQEDNTYIDGTVIVVMLGDLNADGKVDILDIFLAARAFGSEPGHERWDSNADVNGDGKVNILDIFIVANQFGRTY